MTPARGAPLLAPHAAAPDQLPALARQRAFDELLGQDRRAERRLAWIEALCLALAVGGLLLGRLLMERL